MSVTFVTFSWFSFFSWIDRKKSLGMIDLAYLLTFLLQVKNSMGKMYCKSKRTSSNSVDQKTTETVWCPDPWAEDFNASFERCPGNSGKTFQKACCNPAIFGCWCGNLSFKWLLSYDFPGFVITFKVFKSLLHPQTFIFSKVSSDVKYAQKPSTAIRTLFMAITGGIDWVDAMRPLHLGC